MDIEYSVPRGAEEPPPDVLWEFIRACNAAFDSSVAFLKGVPEPAVLDWYARHWRESRLQAILADIDRYYDMFYPHVAFRADELNWKIDEAAKQAASAASSANTCVRGQIGPPLLSPRDDESNS